MNPYLSVCVIATICLNSCVAQTFSEALDDAMETHGVMGMSALVICNGEITEAYYGGLRNYENDWSVDEATRYRIASISKSITAMGCMKLVESAVLDLDLAVSEYLPFVVSNPNHPDADITLRMLLSHTSSVQDGGGYSPFLTATYQSTNDLPSLGELLEPTGTWYTSNMYRTEPPGTHFAYSNLNFGLVATVMEAATGLRFDALMDELIFQPMGLGCSYDAGALEGIENLAALYRNQGGWVAQADQFNGVSPGSPELAAYTPGSNGSRFAPQGGLRASAAELYELMVVLFNGGIASNGTAVMAPETVEAMLTEHWTYDGSNGNNYYNLFNSWGLGIQRVINTAMGDIVFPELQMWGHPGEAYGLISDWYLDPATKDGVIFLTNGVWNGYSFGNNSAFYTLEEDVFAAGEEALGCTADVATAAATSTLVVPNFGRPGEAFVCHVTGSIVWQDALGKTVAQSTAERSAVIPALPAGCYLIRIEGQKPLRFTVL